MVTIEYNPLVNTFPSFPYPYFEREPEHRFWQKFERVETNPDGSCMFQALSLGYHDKKKYWRNDKARICQWLLNLNKDELAVVYGIKSPEELVQKHTSVRAVLEDDRAWGTLDHLNLYERFFNCAIWTWTEAEDGFVIHRKPQVDNNKFKPKFINLLHEKYGNSRTCNHYVFLKPNTVYSFPTRRCGTVCSEVEIFVEESDVDVGTQEEVLDLLENVSDVPDNDSFAVFPDLPALAKDFQAEPPSDLVSYETQNTSSTSTSRPSNEMFQASLTGCDMLEAVSAHLGVKGFCCPSKCLNLVKALQGPFVLQSSISNAPVELITYSRQYTRTLNQGGRSDFVEKSYKNGFEKCEGENEKPNFKMFVHRDNNVRLPVCWKAFDFFYGVSKSMSFRTRKRISEEGLGATRKRKASAFVTEATSKDPESRHLTEEGYEITAFIRVYCESRGDKMPHSEEIRICFSKVYVLKAYQQQLQEKGKSGKVDEKKFYWLWNTYCADIRKARWKGDFAICDVCKACVQKESNPYTSEKEKIENKVSLCRHLRSVELMRHAYAIRRQKAMSFPSTFMSIIIDGCDSNTTTLPNIKLMSKSEEKYRDSLLKHKVMGVRVHAKRKRDYLYMAPPFLGSKVGSNFTIEALAKTLVYEEKLREEAGKRRIA